MKPGLSTKVGLVPCLSKTHYHYVLGHSTSRSASSLAFLPRYVASHDPVEARLIKVHRKHYRLSHCASSGNSSFEEAPMPKPAQVPVLVKQLPELLEQTYLPS